MSASAGTEALAADEWGPLAKTSMVNERNALPPAAPAPELTERTCRTWLAAIARRDEAALSAFYDATITRVFGLALRITRQPESAAEVASDVYFQVWREAGRYDARRGNVTAWLMTICRSRALDLLRRADEAETSRNRCGPRRRSRTRHRISWLPCRSTQRCMVHWRGWSLCSAS